MYCTSIPYVNLIEEGKEIRIINYRESDGERRSSSGPQEQTYRAT